MQGEKALSEEELKAALSKYLGSKKFKVLDVEALLREIPEEGKFVLFLEDLESFKETLAKSGLEVLSEYPLIDAVVVSGKRGLVLQLALNDSVKSFDIVRKVRAVSDAGGKEATRGGN